MLSTIANDLAELNNYPEFGVFYQNYVRDIQDAILQREYKVNKQKLAQLKSFNCVLIQLNELTEELKSYDEKESIR